MAVRVKICGITRLEDMHAACDAGADALGFVFYAKSPRHRAPEQAGALVRALPPFVTSVGLFVNAEPAFVEQVLQNVPLDLLQFHGDETPEDCARFGRPYLKAVRVRPGMDLLQCAADYRCRAGLLLDAYVPGMPGGTGERFDWGLIPAGLPKPVILSGGLTPDNVADAVAAGAALGGGCVQRRGSRQRHQGCGARLPRSLRMRRKRSIMNLTDLPDTHGHFGPYGGIFVAETLMAALDELRIEYEKARNDPEFMAEFEYELKHYVGRPSPVYHARRLSEQSAARRSTSSAKTSTTPARTRSTTPSARRCLPGAWARSA